MTALRIFISYPHRQAAVAERLEAALAANGLEAFRDRQIMAGTHFSDVILRRIAHAHVFMPVIPAEPSMSGWVHQEIGYAAALHVPVLPVCLGDVPSGMIDQIHVARIDPDWDVERLRSELPRRTFERIVMRAMSNGAPLYESTRDTRRRAEMLAQYCRSLTEEGICAPVRQRATLSSFHVPLQLPAHRLWRLRHGSGRRDDDYCRRLTRERQALEVHAAAGCRLLINPDYPYEEGGDLGRAVRLRVLLDFLEARSPADTVVGLADIGPEALTIVGDWFSSRSLAAQHGARWIRLTTFTRHAPTVRADIDEFEEEMAFALSEHGLSEQESLGHAVARITSILAGLPEVMGG